MALCVVQVVGKSILVATEGSAEPTGNVLEMTAGSFVDDEVPHQLETSSASTGVDVGFFDLLLDLLCLDSSLEKGQDRGDSGIPDLSLAFCQALDCSSRGLHLLP